MALERLDFTVGPSILWNSRHHAYPSTPYENSPWIYGERAALCRTFRWQHDESLQRDVAIKVLHQGTSCDPILEARFFRETRLLAELNHPHLVRIFDAGLDCDPPYLVLELLQGRPLNLVIEAERPVPVDEALGMLEQIAVGLEYLHGRSICHRDLKPSNIFITHDKVVKILDLGLARASSSTLITQGDDRVGTPLYLAPENIQGQTKGAGTDLWGLGCVAYHLLAGHAHIRERDPASILRAIVEEPSRSTT